MNFLSSSFVINSFAFVADIVDRAKCGIRTRCRNIFNFVLFHDSLEFLNRLFLVDLLYQLQLYLTIFNFVV